ncbi:MAG TPA: hypothetical protein VIL04_03410 [Solirubrobacterales bacterium]|jgi:hypothetical protein
MEAGSSTPKAHEAPATAEESRRPGALGTVLISLAGLIGLLFLLAGLTLLALHAFARDDGFYTTDAEPLESEGFAIVSDPIDLGPSSGLDVSDANATVRLIVEGSGAPAFVGIGPADDVAAYLEGVEHTVLTDWDGSGFDEWGGEPVYEQIAGGRPPSAPAEQDFWVASSEGQGQQVLDWDVEGGTWAVLVANADASPGVAVDAEAGLRVGWLVWVGVGLTMIGLIITGLCAWGLYSRLRRRPAA